ncbi:class I SAM-dependent methyltransferase [Catenulispora subtropica]|uniref:Class I SAM-dependent methyltransferase n=1 Tax=Catenulispora subtropica TaxID=450798 RepID=A0ABN2SBF8_9ACTN
MAEPVKVQLGAVQQTLFIPLAGRARESRRKHPLVRDPKAAQIMAAVDFDAARYSRGWGAGVTVLRTAVFDEFVRGFLADHPEGTVVELGTGLNSRFDRVDNGRTRWIDLDLPDTVELRRRFFEDTDRRRMVAASVLDEDWMAVVAASPGPYLFVAEGVLVYLDEAPTVLTRIAERFPGALLVFDTYTKRMLDQQHRMAAKRNLTALWAWPCDDPHTLEPLGLEVVRASAVTRPPATVRARLPRRYRYALPLLRPVVGDVAAVTLFRAR